MWSFTDSREPKADNGRDMESTQPNQDQWESCQAGEIRGLVARLRSRRRVRSAQDVALWASALVVIAGSYLFVSSRTGTDRGQAVMSCSDVRQHAEAFLAGQLDQATAERIRKHVEACPDCQRWIAQFRKSSPRRPKTSWHGPRRASAGTGVARLLRHETGTIPLASLD